jgi:hypothetical protein
MFYAVAVEAYAYISLRYRIPSTLTNNEFVLLPIFYPYVEHAQRACHP